MSESARFVTSQLIYPLSSAPTNHKNCTMRDFRLYLYLGRNFKWECPWKKGGRKRNGKTENYNTSQF